MGSCGCCGAGAAISDEGMPARRFGSTAATAPGPSGPQMLRSAREVATEPLRYLEGQVRAGPVVQFPIPTPATFLVSGRHAVREVLQTQSHVFDKDTVQYRALSLVTGEGLLAATEGVWRQQRPVVQPAFHHRVLNRVADDVQSAVARLVERWMRAGDGVVDIDAAMLRLGLEVVGAHLFHADLRRSAPDLAESTLVALESVVQAASPPWGLLPARLNPRRRRFDAALEHLEAAVDGVLDHHRTLDPTPADLLGLLRRHYRDGPAGRRAIRDQVVTFMVAGHETVASSLTWTLGLLGQHPDAQEQLAAELDEVVGSGPVSIGHFDRLAYTRAVVDEGLRLYPPAWIITRTATTETVLRNRLIPAGSLVMISPWVEHRDPHRWDRGEEFRPERFIQSGAGSAARPGAVSRRGTARADYLPFGSGPRLCIGRDMAVVESVLVLAGLARHWTFHPVTQQLPAPDAMVTLRPRGGLRLGLSPRSSRTG